MLKYIYILQIDLYYQLVDKGLTPHQLLNVPFPKRLPKIEEDFSLSFSKNKLKYNSFKNKKKIYIFIAIL